MTNRKVMVTGLGAVTPLGNTLDETWTNAVQGASASVASKTSTSTACA